MSALYFANIGNRDVKHSNINQVIPRLSGKEWLDKYDTVKSQLDFPILRNGLEYALRELNGKPINRLILFYTDQPESVGEKYRQSDTLYFAELIKRIIEAQMTDRIDAVELIPITGAPNDYDDMYQFYSKQMESVNHLNTISHVFFAPSGGTPACNMTMVLHGSRIFQQKSRVILISETPGSTPKSLNISTEIIRSHNRQALEKMTEQYNYNGISSLLRFSDNPKDRALMNLALYAHYRLCLDYQSAIRYLREIQNSALSAEPLLQELLHTAELFTKEPPILHSEATKEDKEQYLQMKREQSCEICLCAIIKFKTGQYTDFVGRIFRIQEGLVRWFFEFYCGYSSNVSKKFKYHDDFKHFRSTAIGQEFEVYLKKKIRKNYRWEPNRTILTKFWSWVMKNKADEDMDLFPELLDFVKRVDTLGDLRNDSSIAHGFAPVTREVICELYKGNLLQDLENLPGRFKLNWNLGIYDQLNELILRYY